MSEVSSIPEVIESFMLSLHAEIRIFPDLWAERLSEVLQGYEDPGAMRRHGDGPLIMVETGEPYERPDRKY